MIAVFVLAAAMVYLQNNSISFHAFLQMRFKIENYALFSGFIILWHLIFSGFGLYHSRRFSTTKAEIKDLLKATTVGTLFIILAAWIFRIGMVTPIFLVVFWGGTSMVTIVSRLVMRSALKWARLHSHNIRYMLIVGSNERAREFARRIESKPELGYSFLGFVDEKWDGNRDLEKYGWKLVSDFNGFTEFIRINVVDEVLIALPIKSYYQETAGILYACENQGLFVRHLPNIFNTKVANSRVEQFFDESYVSHNTGQMVGWQVLDKGILDRMISSVLLLLLSPLVIVTVILIKITSPGPIFFVQERVGLNKRRFSVFKFRTMVKDAEQKQVELEDLNEVGGAAFKILNDPRITTVGKFLRKFSIDELPQFINVLKGDMSLVGPRPLPVRDYNGFNIDWQRRRFSVRPGITCLWQINGRHNIPFERWIELDLEYIDRWSLLLDLSILIRTIPAVLKGFGAS